MVLADPRGDLGQSILLSRSVAAAIVERLPVTLALAGIALVIAVVVGVAAGVVAALAHNRWPDQAVMAAALLGLSVPDFWLGLMMVFVFGVQLGLFPTGGFVPFQESAIGWARSIALPALALALVQVGFIARMARASMLDALSQDFIRTADAKGLSRIRHRHAAWAPERSRSHLDRLGHRRRRAPRRHRHHRTGLLLPGIGRLVIGAVLSATSRSSREGSCSWRSST